MQKNRNTPTAWREAFEAARGESDPLRISRAVEAAETAIFCRFQELHVEPGDHQQERIEIRRAATQLRELQVAKLRYP